MKKLLIFFVLTATPVCIAQDTGTEKPSYQSEAPLPEGWPAPGPYDQVSEKTYPKYRAAVTTGGSGMSFWTLFSHIKKKEIPMTAPVEMKMEDKGEKIEKREICRAIVEGSGGHQAAGPELDQAPPEAESWEGSRIPFT